MQYLGLSPGHHIQAMYADLSAFFELLSLAAFATLASLLAILASGLA